MSRPPVVGAGLKMFLGYAETVRYLHELAASAEQFEGVSVFVLPSFPVLAAAQDLLSSSPVLYGAQDGHWEEAGPYTGCVSPAMLRELGCTFVEVGHAERRRLFHETDAVVARKAVAAARSGLTPIVCVGEERMGDPAHRVVAAQVVSVLESLPEHADLVIAYEPVWAIGAAAAAEPRHIEEVVSMVRRAHRRPRRRGSGAVRRQRRSRWSGRGARHWGGRRVRRAVGVGCLGSAAGGGIGAGGGMSETVAIGADEAGVALKQRLIDELQKTGVEVADYGCREDETVDYPDVALAVAQAIAAGEHSRGILICGTGIGMAIAANKVPGVYAAQVHDPYSAERARNPTTLR